MKRLLLLLGYVALLAASILSYSVLTKRERLAYVLAISQLAPLPAKARTVQVDIESMFLAQTFWVSFKASGQDIQRWVRRSPALNNHDSVTIIKATVVDNMPLAGTPTWFKQAALPTGFYIRFRQVHT
ncbi:hypothetical protein [Hymenobacter coccineus]|uniref:hypothetical protein n=1 Tax=Hymenobacter coccineus TaxID=1908235 RepID=UPI000F765E99|nr:hypothetical protein [Hymenobacter coccineus]